MTQIDNGTWVLIADGEKALFLENKTDGQDPFFEVFREEEQDNPPKHTQPSCKSARTVQRWPLGASLSGC